MKQYDFASELLSLPPLSLVKCSVLLFLLRFRETSPRLRILVWSLLTFHLIWLVVCEIITLFRCRPIPYQWNKSIHGGYCRDMRSTYISISAMAVLTDILVLVPPIWIVAHTTMQRRLKVAVMFLFFLAIM